jgi:hypothetical protein
VRLFSSFKGFRAIVTHRLERFVDEAERVRPGDLNVVDDDAPRLAASLTEDVLPVIAVLDTVLLRGSDGEYVSLCAFEDALKDGCPTRCSVHF